MKIISDKEYKEYMKLKKDKPLNEFAQRGWLANSLALCFEQVIIYLMKMKYYKLLKVCKIHFS